MEAIQGSLLLIEGEHEKAAVEHHGGPDGDHGDPREVSRGRLAHDAPQLRGVDHEHGHERAQVQGDALHEAGASYIFGPGTNVPEAAVELIEELVRRLGNDKP